jgi:ribosomal protein L7/L12
MFTIIVLVIVILVVVLSVRRSQKRAADIKRTIESVTKDFPLGGVTSMQALQEQVKAAVAQAMAPGAATAQAVPSSPFARPETSPQGTLGVGEIISISSLATGSPEAILELDAIGAPKRRVVAPLSEGHGLTRGDRIYVLLDQNDPSVVALAPASMTGVQTLPVGANRLDALVLGPQILEAGAKAKGIVKTADSMPMADATLAARGFSKWRLDLEVTPESGWPYRAELTISLSTPEKAARIAHAGAEVALRYDPDDTKTVSIDSIAMGYGNPYETLSSPTQSTRTVTFTTTTTGSPGGQTVLLVNAGRNPIEVIKTVRSACPGMSLLDAKNLVESAPQKLLENITPEQADSIKRQLESAGATVIVV